MKSGKYERRLINMAVKKLGHPYSSPPDGVALKYLLPYIKEKLKKSNKLRRAQMAEAARYVLDDIEVVSKKVVVQTRTENKPKPVKKKKAADKFYATWEWKKVRMLAFKANGQRCQCCGWRPGDTEHGHLVVDHIKPRSKYPHLQLDLSNLQVLCNDCNMGKSNIFEDDFRAADSWLSEIFRG